jgi:Caspase domain
LASTSAQAAEKRIALVVGNANYSSGALPTPANDAGLIAQTLQAAGFDVVGVRDLDQDSLRRTFRDFIAKASAAGPDRRRRRQESRACFQPGNLVRDDDSRTMRL